MKAAAIAIVVLTATAAHAEPVDPIGAVGGGGELSLTGGGPRSRLAAEATAYLTRTYGVYVAAHRVMIDPIFDEGQVTAGVAMRAAAARPLLEVVLHGDAGYAWPTAATIGGGVTTYLWPVRAIPVALTTGATAYFVLGGEDDARVVVGLGLGLAIAR